MVFFSENENDTVTLPYSRHPKKKLKDFLKGIIASNIRTQVQKVSTTWRYRECLVINRDQVISWLFLKIVLYLGNKYKFWINDISESQDTFQVGIYQHNACHIFQKLNKIHYFSIYLFIVGAYSKISKVYRMENITTEEVIVAKNYIFGLIWRCNGPKRYILDYWGTIIYYRLSYFVLSKDKGL